MNLIIISYNGLFNTFEMFKTVNKENNNTASGEPNYNHTLTKFSKELFTKLQASSQLWTCQPLRYTSKFSNSVFLYEPPTLVLPLKKKSLPTPNFSSSQSSGPPLPALAWHAKSPFCGTGAFTGAVLLADVPACQLRWKNNWRVRLGWEFPAFLSPHNEVKMWDNRS